MSPHAGATLAHRGTTPAKSAPHPSVRMTCNARGKVLALCLKASGEHPGEGVNTCLRVLRTSNGWVTRAETVPLRAPERKDVAIGVSCGRGELRELSRALIISKPAQYSPEKGTSRHSVGPSPRQRMVMPLSRTRAAMSRAVEPYVGAGFFADPSAKRHSVTYEMAELGVVYGTFRLER